VADTWTQRAYAATAPMWAKIDAHPFLKELADGTLPDEKLVFYFEQNVYYIEAVIRCRAVAVAKATNPEVRDFFLGPIPVFVDELKHQQTMLTRLGGRANPPIAPACHAYTRHILTLAWSREPVEYFGAFLPCPWTYDLIGQRFKGKLQKQSHIDWWEFYMSREHNDMCDRYRGMVDRLAAELPPARQDDMIENFRLSLRYEYRFWDMAYKLEQWEI
jgi:thiaminase (transcriptional activator TenA)